MNTNQLHRDVWVEIHLDKIEANTRQLRKFLPKSVKLTAAVKANAYGYGDVEVASTVLKAGADGLAVSILQEGLHLRKNRIQGPILVLTPILPEDVDLAIENDLSVTVFQPSWVEKMKIHKLDPRPIKIHLKIDTGLGRIGISTQQELEKLLQQLNTKDVVIEGMYTHFATANHEDESFFRQQLGSFLSMVQWIEKQGIRIPFYHCCNTAAALKHPEAHLDMVRVGVGLFGIYPSLKIKETANITLASALSFHSKVLHIKEVKKGSRLGYDQAYQADEDQWIATIPVGYGDGWYRCFQDFHVLIAGEKAPIVGNICMDQLMVKLSHQVPVGTQVTLIGKQGSLEITLEELAAHIGSVPQEIPSMIGPRVPRMYYYEGHPVEILTDRSEQNLPLMESRIEEIVLDLKKS